ncbi:MAG: nitroreductase family protein, partial [archaeon]
MELDKAIQTRHSVRKFKDKSPDWRDIIECIDAARYAPMAGGMYSLRFILVDDQSVIQKIANAASQQFITKAKYVVVACSNPSLTINSYDERGKRY